MAQSEENAKKKPIFVSRVCGAAVMGVTALLLIICAIGLTILLVADSYHAVKLSDQGISTRAKVLAYKHTYTKYSRFADESHNHLIQYRDFRNKIKLDRKYPVGSSVEVIYDKDDPSLVWQGNRNMSILELYVLNSDTSRGQVLDLIYFHLLYISLIYYAYISGKAGLDGIWTLVHENRISAASDPCASMELGKSPQTHGGNSRNSENKSASESNKGRKLLIGYITILVLAIASLSFFMLMPTASNTSDLTKANEYLKNKDLKKAEMVFSEVINKDPNSRVAYIGRAKVFLLKRQVDAALSDIDRAIELGADTAESHFLRGIAFVGKKDHVTALSEYAIALKRDPFFRDAHLNAGISYYGLKDYPNAVKEYKKYIEMSSDEGTGIERAKRLLSIAEKEAVEKYSD